MVSAGPLTHPAVVNEFLKNHLEDKDREYFVALLLDIRNKVLAVHHVSIGTLNSTLITPRELFKAAILVGAASVILAHNHPSGDPLPSLEDIETTRNLAAAGKIIGIQVLDHIIVGEYCVSLRDRGFMEPA